jgi:hypothetical protein
MIFINSSLHISFRISHSSTLHDGCVILYRKNKLDSRTKSAHYPADDVSH